MRARLDKSRVNGHTFSSFLPLDVCLCKSVDVASEVLVFPTLFVLTVRHVSWLEFRKDIHVLRRRAFGVDHFRILERFLAEDDLFLGAALFVKVDLFELDEKENTVGATSVPVLKRRS